MPATDDLDVLDDIDVRAAIDDVEREALARDERTVVDVEVDGDEVDADEVEEWGPIEGPALRVDQSAIHGTGVFAGQRFAPEDLMERCPVLIVPPNQAKRVVGTMLGDYVYEWEGGSVVALGFGSLYNHSRSPNARYEMDYDLEEIHVVALRVIDEGEEILVNYNGDPTDTSPVWFEVDEDGNELEYVDETEAEIADEGAGDGEHAPA